MSRLAHADVKLVSILEEKMLPSHRTRTAFYFFASVIFCGCSFIFPLSDAEQIEELIPGLSSEDPTEVQAAKNAMSKILPRGSEALTSCSSTAESRTRAACLSYLPLAGELPATETRDVLKKGIESTDPVVQRAAVYAAAGMLDYSETTAPAISKLLESPSADIQSMSLIALGFMGEKAKAALPAVKGHLQATDPLVRIQAIATAIRIGGRDVRRTLGRSVSFLVGSLRSPDHRIRVGAINALGQLGWHARSSINAIQKYVQESQSDAEKVQAALALWRIGSAQSRKAAQEIIVKARSSTDPLVKSAVAAYDATSSKQEN